MSRHYLYDHLRQHLGHTLECVAYGDPNNPQDICIECVDCNEVLISVETLEEEVNNHVEV